MKVWEQEWAAVQFNSGGYLKTELHHGEDQTSCIDWGECKSSDPSAADDIEAARLAAAAPEMARLLTKLEWDHAECNICGGLKVHEVDCELAAVLRKAGIAS